MEITLDYEPRELQLDFHEKRKRWSLLVCHRRWGKTFCAIQELIRGVFTCPLNSPRFAYVAPTYKQGKNVAWDYLKRFSEVIPEAIPNESELRIDYPNGGRITIYGSDKPDSLRGIYLDGVVMDEYGNMLPSVFTEIIRPTLSDRKGWAMFIGTPKGKNEFQKLYRTALKDDDWYTKLYKASETKIIDDEELADCRKMMPEEEYAQEYECSFEGNMMGAYYAGAMTKARDEGRVGIVPYDPALPVHTWWDLGVNDSTSIWFVQFYGLEIRVIDYYENNGEGLPFYAKILQKKDYIYGYHIAPFDIRVKELGTGVSRIETARKLGIRFRVAPKLPVNDGIEAVRGILHRCYFDEKNVGRGLDCLENYKKEYNEKTQEYRPTPYHDWTSHGCDAFRYGAVMINKVTKKRKDRYKLAIPEVAWMGT